MNKRDDFLPKTRKILAQRCAYRCSNPNCTKITVGAHSQKDKSLCIGKASHIEAAAKGGSRYNRDMSPEQRRSISNGIWLCSDCAEMIDKDVNKYTVELLKNWKLKAEQEVDVRNAKSDRSNGIRILAVANSAGGTGKSFVSASMSITIARVTNSKVLCVSTTMLDHALIILGLKREKNYEFHKVLLSDGSELSTYTSPLYNNVDAVFIKDLKEIAFQQYVHFGKTDLKKVLVEAAEILGYKYIICDCGRGIDTDIEKEILLSSSDVIIPLGQHCYASHGMEIIYENLRYSGYFGEIWILYSVGYLTSSEKVNLGMRREFLEAQEKFQDLKTKIHEIKTVVPKNNFIEQCTWGNKDIFSCSKTKNVVQSYEEIFNEITI